ncbi:hypothetical protein ACIPZ8_21860 [Pseudomonas sp. NPDC089422]|uniref:hypothetical protein n=1 Tax=Pseudomonas sp. NPDC089422 TaxID=3364466 RepID=UPI00382C2E81
MSAKEIRLSLGDIDNDNSPEVFIEYYAANDFEFSITVSSSKKNGIYDKVNGTGDADGDGDLGDPADNELYIKVANLAVQLLKSS